ncbi:RepB family DNA primase [Occallatibacter riparius]|uniref:RepB family DNA primase n=1 Tax=Occallatibacter riparius TaxID=1002689 RepID=A0A9J7BRC0_9BACT|nr:RepB family DNA primase [Occallatibacter riparius]UWZ85129.1 RepB family DNA primase [Occallatibacter riparius]
MDRTIIAVHRMLDALAAASYDVGVLSERGMFPGHASLTKEAILTKLKFLKSQNARGAHIYVRPSGIHNLTVLDDLRQESVDRLSADGFEPCAVVETSPGNFQGWLKHHRTYESPVSTFIAQELARRYAADPSAADWRRFGRLPGFTNCKPKHRQLNGFFPFVLLRSCSGKQFTRAEAFGLEVASRYQLQQEENRLAIERRIEQQKRFPHAGRRYLNLSVERFRALPRYHDRPAAADIAFCISALSLEMPEDAIMRALEDDYLSRDLNPSRRAAYIRRTLLKARAWARL